MANQEGSSRVRMASYKRLEKPRETENKDVPKAKRDGLISTAFILVNEACQKVVSFGLFYNMIVYLTTEYHMMTANTNKAIFFWNLAADFMILLLGFVSHSFMGRFPIIGFGSIFSLLGIFLLWSTAMIPQLRPPPCTSSGCPSATTAQLSYLFSSFPMVSVRAGCVSRSTAFGMDQFQSIDKSEHKTALERFFMYYHASSSFLFITSVTVTCYIQEKHGWEKAFRLPFIQLILFVTLFFIRSPQYIKEKPS